MPQELTSIWWGLVLLGLGAGILSGTLGLGSGTILIPVLVLVFALPQKSAQGTALAVMVPMALLGAARYWMNPDIEEDLRLVGLIVPGALIGSLIGTELAARVPGHALKKIFAAYLLIVAVKILIFSPWSKGRPEESASRTTATLIQEGSADDDTDKRPED